MEKYGEVLINETSKLDIAMNAHGKIKELALLIIEENNPSTTKALLKQISFAITYYKDDMKIKRIAKDVNSSLVAFHGYTTIQKLYSPAPDEDPRTLEELLDELNSLVGLSKVKEKVQDLIAYQKVQKMRREKGMHTVKNTLHIAFTGNPGTGKTTVARIVGRIYKKLGLLSKGHFLEVSRTDLIAGYQGQTAIKVKKVIEKAKGGVLFIDEAYSLVENEHSDSYGRESLTELTKALEDYRDDLVVIVAGYTEPMNLFFASNPGLKSRFNTFIEFDDYVLDELIEILELMCSENEYELHADAKVKIKESLARIVDEKSENFSNGRLIRNLFDEIVMNHARRIQWIDNPTKEELSILTPEDFIDL